MAHILFYGKPGCINNQKQKTLLEAAGYEVESRNLLREPWDDAMLRSFFGDLPIPKWFNPSAPRLLQGEIEPETLSETEALALMIEDPLLIRRPLIEMEGIRNAGFDLNRLSLSGLDADQDLEGCLHKTTVFFDKDEKNECCHARYAL